MTSPATPKRRPKRLRARRPAPTVAQVLAWADDHRARTGRWPTKESGRVLANPNETWKAVGLALLRGGRGLAGGTTLARLLARERGARNKRDLPALTEDQVVAWAQAHHARTGAWPTEDAGPVEGAPGEVWKNVEAALRCGRRGLPGGDSLARLLARRLGLRNRADAPPLSAGVVLAWADAHRARTGRWPGTRSGPVAEAPGEDWRRVDDDLRKGHRGLAGGSSLARLLAERRGARNPVRPPPLTARRVLAWADAHRRRSGAWPTQNSGPVSGAAGESWKALDAALRQGLRGLPAGSSLARLLAERRGGRNPAGAPRLTIRAVLGRADAHFARTGCWPSRGSGAVAGAPGESWGAVDAALRQGVRGLHGGYTLARFLDRHRRWVREPR